MTRDMIQKSLVADGKVYLSPSIFHQRESAWLNWYVLLVSSGRGASYTSREKVFKKA